MLDKLSIHELFGHLRAQVAQPHDPQQHVRLNALCARAWRLDEVIFEEQWAPYLRTIPAPWRLADLAEHLERHAADDPRALSPHLTARLIAGHPVPETIILYKTLEIDPALEIDALEALLIRSEALSKIPELRLSVAQAELLLLILSAHDLGPTWMPMLDTITLTGPFPSTAAGWRWVCDLRNALWRPIDTLHLVGGPDGARLDLAALEAGLSRAGPRFTFVTLGGLELRYDDDVREPRWPITISFSRHAILSPAPAAPPPEPTGHMDVQPHMPQPGDEDPILTQPLRALRRALYEATGATHVRIVDTCVLRPPPALGDEWPVIALA